VIDATTETTNADGIANSAARILPTDTVVLSRTASVGFVARMGRPMATSQDFVNWVCGPNLDPEFLMHLLIRSRDFIQSLSSGATHKTVYYPTVKSFWVCVPDVGEQRRIAQHLTRQAAAIANLATRLKEGRRTIDALPAAFLREAFA
jgi:type I restriction enzyme S subunit